MCYCTIFYKCGHSKENFKPYHCKCDSITVEDKKYRRRCDDCEDDTHHTTSLRDEGRRFKHESTSEMRMRLAQDKSRAGEEAYKKTIPTDDKESKFLSMGAVGDEDDDPTKVKLSGQRQDGEEQQQVENYVRGHGYPGGQR